MELPKTLKFECQSSCPGKCCTVPQGKNLFVFLTRNDRIRLSAFLRKPLNKFCSMGLFTSTRFTNKPSRQWFLNSKKGSNTCQFLRSGKCSVYEVRPTQCRTWPYWPELVNETAWEELKKECPGIGIDGTDSMEADLKLQEQVETDAIYAKQNR